MTPFLPTRMLLPAVLTALSAAPALAAPMGCGPAGPSRITVTGEGRSSAAPDLATIQLGVTTQADSAAAAMDDNSTRQQAVIEALTAAGVPEDQIQTSGLNLNPLMQYGENQAPAVTGYQAVNMVSVRITDLPALGTVLDAIVGAGANEINGITFTREDGDAASDQARSDAVSDARRKAQVLADAAGVDLGPILSISDMPTGNQPPMPMMRMEAASADAVPIQPGQVQMQAAVQIDYALAGPDACASMGGRDRPHQVVPPMPGDGAPAPDEPIVPMPPEAPAAPAN